MPPFGGRLLNVCCTAKLNGQPFGSRAGFVTLKFVNAVTSVVHGDSVELFVTVTSPCSPPSNWSSACSSLAHGGRIAGLKRGRTRGGTSGFGGTAPLSQSVVAKPGMHVGEIGLEGKTTSKHCVCTVPPTHPVVGGAAQRPTVPPGHAVPGPNATEGRCCGVPATSVVVDAGTAG